MSNLKFFMKFSFHLRPLDVRPLDDPDDLPLDGLVAGLVAGLFARLPLVVTLTSTVVVAIVSTISTIIIRIPTGLLVLVVLFGLTEVGSTFVLLLLAFLTVCAI